MGFDLANAKPVTDGGFDLANAKPVELPSKPFGQQLNDAIADVPRQVGLTARYGIEGVGNTLNFLSSPFRAGMNALLPSKAPSLSGLVTGQGNQDAIQPANFSGIADYIGLPKPANATERVVGDITRTMAGSAVPIAAAANVAKNTSGVTSAVANTLASNPAQQIVSGGASGGAGGYVRETGGNDGSQLAASLVAGVATPYAMNKVQNAGSQIGSVYNKLANPSSTNAQIELQIEQALNKNGLTIGDLPPAVQNSIRDDVSNAYKVNGTLSPDSVRRLADYRLTNTTPTAATITLDPAMVTQQKNLAKLGVNSKDVAAQQLAQTENSNNGQLITGLNALGANTADDAIAGGTKVINALSDRNNRAGEIIGRRYDLAKASNGRSAALDPNAFTTRADELLTENLRNGDLPPDIRNRLNDFATGKTPLNVDTAEQFKTMMGKVQRTSSDGGARDAISHVRTALDDTPLLGDQGQTAIDAFNKARATNRAWMQIVEKTPALQAVRDGTEPDKFVQNFIVGNGNKANVADVSALKASIKGDPNAMDAVKQQIAAHLKKSAINGASDEVGNFSQSAYNKALSGIGDQKLSMFFNNDELAQLKAIGRVASYEQFQPKGSAVNNSNTAGTFAANMLDRIGNSALLSKIPFGDKLSGPAQNIVIGMKSKQALNMPNALVGPGETTVPTQFNPLLLSPAMMMNQDDKKRNSLAP